jgi:hypothetical protein
MNGRTPPAPITGATDSALINSCPAGIHAVSRFADVADDASAVVTAVLRRAISDLDQPGVTAGELPDQLRSVPVLLAADDHCVDMATVFTRRCDQPHRRLRPSDSIRLETSELLRSFASTTGWHGPAYVLVSPRRAAVQALRLAGAMTSSLHSSAIVCELHAAADPDPAAPPKNPSGPYLVVAQAITPGFTCHGIPDCVDATDPYLRSALLRAAYVRRAADVSPVVSSAGARS